MTRREHDSDNAAAEAAGGGPVDGGEPLTASTRDEARRRVEVERAEFHRQVEAKKARARRAREEGDRTMKAGWGAFGVVGWSIVVPALIGVVAGMWIDSRIGGGIRYTLSFLTLGIVMGMVNVWNWMNKQ